jgi:hypothetical protein
MVGGFAGEKGPVRRRCPGFHAVEINTVRPESPDCENRDRSNGASHLLPVYINGEMEAEDLIAAGYRARREQRPDALDPLAQCADRLVATLFR